MVPLYVAHDANVGKYDEELGLIPDTDNERQPRVFEMDQEWLPFSDNA